MTTLLGGHEFRGTAHIVTVTGVITPGVSDYAQFLSEPWRQRSDSEPASTWWNWRDHNIHVLRRRDPLSAAPVRLLMIHGAGGHSAALWPIASLLSKGRVDLTAVDLPLYGDTKTPDRAAVRYQDWVDMLCDFIAAEDDGRPLVLLGASIGGMLAYEVAARSGQAFAVAVTCLLDPRDWRARSVMTRFGPAGVLGTPLASLVRGRIARMLIPMSRVAVLAKMSRNRDLSRLCAADTRGGGAAIPLGFLASYMTYRHTPPEIMQTPVMLVHPANDAWTPVAVSMRWLNRVAAPTELVTLRECGHFPIEAPGIGDLVDAVERITRRAEASARK